MSNLSAPTTEVKLARTTEISRTADLLFQLVKRDFSIRFTGSALGFSWAILQPLSLVILYWFVFSFMLPARVPGGSGGDYIFFLISGLLPWLGFNEGIVRATTALAENAPMVRRLALKSEVLVLVPNVTAMIFEAIGLALFAMFLLARGGEFGSLWLLPFAMLIQLTIQTGLSLLLAPTYVFFRDILQVVAFVLSIIFYLSPILYTIAERFRPIFEWNPLTPLLGLFRSATIGSPLPPAGSIVFLLAFAALCLLGGWMFFRRMQPAIVDFI